MASTTRAQASPYGRSFTYWLTTTNHKSVGILYLVTGLGFFLVAATFAMLMRTQTMVPNNTFLGPDAYDQIFTMHGTTMVFLFGMPVLAGFANFFVPLSYTHLTLPTIYSV